MKTFLSHLTAKTSFFSARYAAVALTALLLSVIPFVTACDELDRDGDAILEVLPGKWAFTYETSENLGMEFNYEYVVFNSDGRCAITFPGGQDEGTYRASDDAIAIDTGETLDGRIMLWRVDSFSPYEVTATYTFDWQGTTATATIWLEKVADL